MGVRRWCSCLCIVYTFGRLVSAPAAQGWNRGVGGLGVGVTHHEPVDLGPGPGRIWEARDIMGTCTGPCTSRMILCLQERPIPGQRSLYKAWHALYQVEGVPTRLDGAPTRPLWAPSRSVPSGLHTLLGRVTTSVQSRALILQMESTPVQRAQTVISGPQTWSHRPPSYLRTPTYIDVPRALHSLKTAVGGLVA